MFGPRDSAFSTNHISLKAKKEVGVSKLIEIRVETSLAVIA